MPDAVRYAILDDASDEAPLWELPWELKTTIDGKEAQTHPPRSIDEVRPVLTELLRDGHVELYPMADPQGPTLSLEEALAAVADDASWTPQPSMKTAYCLVITESGEHELQIEYEAAQTRAGE